MLAAHLVLVLAALAKDWATEASSPCQRLSGNWIDHRYCYPEPDLILIYKKPEDTPNLVQLSSHSDLDL